MSALLDPVELRKLVDDAKDMHNLSDVIARRTTLKTRGKMEMVGLCPFHLEKSPSFEVNDAKGLFHCHGCGASGDHLRFLMYADGLTFRQAYEALTGGDFPTVTPEERAQRKREADAVIARRIAAGKRAWTSSGPVAGTPAEVYARSRGITAPLPDTVRFALMDYRDQGSGAVTHRAVPTMVCALQDADGSVVGVQRIYLAADGSGKLAVRKAKLSLGVIVGSAFRASGSQQPSESVIVCEGPEDGLSLAQELPGSDVWVACGTGLMPRLDIPRYVTRAVLAGDNNDAGREAVARTCATYMDRGFEVSTMFPEDGFTDWNNELRGVRA